MDDETEIEDIVSRLDSIVPRDSGWVEFTQYGGGPDEGKINANKDGYRRLGIEFLKSTLLNQHDEFEVDIEYLVSPESTINFDLFTLNESRLNDPITNTLADRILPFVALLIGLIGIGIFITGMATIGRWILG